MKELRQSNCYHNIKYTHPREQAEKPEISAGIFINFYNPDLWIFMYEAGAEKDNDVIQLRRKDFKEADRADFEQNSEKTFIKEFCKMNSNFRGNSV